MKKSLLFLITALVLSRISQAQLYIGAEIGYASSIVNTNVSNLSDIRVSAQGGFSAAVPLQYQIKKNWSLSSGLQYVQKNYQYTGINANAGLAGLYTNYNNTYLQLPLALRYTIGKRLQPFAEAGFYIGYWISASQDGYFVSILPSGSSNISYASQSGINTTTSNQFEVGGTVAIGLRFELVKNTWLFVKATDYEGFNSTQKTLSTVSQIPIYNSTLSFTAGATVPFRTIFKKPTHRTNQKNISK